MQKPNFIKAVSEGTIRNRNEVEKVQLSKVRKFSLVFSKALFFALLGAKPKKNEPNLSTAGRYFL